MAAGTEQAAPPLRPWKLPLTVACGGCSAGLSRGLHVDARRTDVPDPSGNPFDSVTRHDFVCPGCAAPVRSGCK